MYVHTCLAGYRYDSDYGDLYERRRERRRKREREEEESLREWTELYAQICVCTCSAFGGKSNTSFGTQWFIVGQ